MRLERNRIGGGFALGVAVAWIGAGVSVRAQTPPVPLIAPVAPTTQTAPAIQPPATNVVVWDALQKEVTPKPEDQHAEFTFSVTNVSAFPVTIDHVQPSCGCTLVTLPAEPWVIAPGSNGQLTASVDLAGKSGILYKYLTVSSTNFPQTTLSLVVHTALSPEVMRAQNQMAAMADRQKVFKDDCAKCHVEPAQGKMAKELYATACGICHESAHRATMVPDLQAIKHPTDYDYWKQWIRNGKPGTLMPAFATDQGGPLTDEQIESLAKTLAKVFPGAPAGQTNGLGRAQTNASAGVIPPR